MSGQLVTGTPWGRSALARLDPIVREGIETLIPDGHTVVVSPRANRADLSLILRNGSREVRRVVSRSIEIGCDRLLLEPVTVEATDGHVVVADMERAS